MMKIAIFVLFSLFLTTFAKSVPQVPQDSTTCIMCEFIVKTLEDIVTENATEQQIINAVKHVCDILPSSIRAPCTQFIAQNGDALIHLLIDRVPPHVACVKLHICKNAFVEVPKDSTLCPMCNIFVGMAEQFLNSNHTIDQIEQILHNFPCQFIFDGEMEKQCEKFIDSYVPQLIEWIVKNESPVIFCTQIGLCP